MFRHFYLTSGLQSPIIATVQATFFGGNRMKPIEELKAEHGGVIRMLEILQAIVGKLGSRKEVPDEHIDHIMEFLKVFVDKCHHGKEEEFLFPALEEAGIPREGGPIGVMLQEHQTGREIIGKMSASLDGLGKEGIDAKLIFKEAAETYIELLRQHIDKENNVLFPMADERLSQETQDQMSGQFERLERERIGEGRHEAFHKLLKDLAGIYIE
jgi:hemerythrin-like domain-containing protein